jgi:hypothetical protein
VVSALDAWVTDLAAYARSSETLEMALEVSKASASLELELSPVKGGKAASWIDDIPVGRARNVLSLPAGCSLAIWTNSSPGDRAGDASALNAGLESLLGPRLSEPEHKAMLGIFENLAKGRGDELLVGFVVAPQAGLLVQGTVSDQAAIAAALEKLPSLFRMSVVAEPLASFVGRPNVVPSQPSLAGTRSVRLEFASAGRAKGDGQSFEAIWSADEKHYRWVAGPAPARALFQLLREPTSTLQSSARLAARLGAIEHASSVILLNPSNLGLLDATSGETEMALVVAGRRNGHASIEVEVPSDVVRAGLSSGFQP